MALAYKTLQHMRIGDRIVPPGTTIPDPEQRDVKSLLDKGLVTVVEVPDDEA